MEQPLHFPVGSSAKPWRQVMQTVELEQLKQFLGQAEQLEPEKYLPGGQMSQVVAVPLHVTQVGSQGRHEVPER